jgi:hypothetical protein
MLGKRWIYADHKLQTVMQSLVQLHQPDAALFSIPLEDKSGEVDNQETRKIGEHFIARFLDNLGLSPDGLQTYHGTQMFSREVQKLLQQAQTSWEAARTYGLQVVAQEMGLAVDSGLDDPQTLSDVQTMFVDPLVVEVLEQNATEAGLVDDSGEAVPPPAPAVTAVSLDLVTRTPDEQFFSQWLHTYPVHLHTEPPSLE